MHEIIPSARRARQSARLLACAVFLSLPGCAFFEDEEEQLTAEEQYQAAVEQSKIGDSDATIEAYQDLISTYPQSRFAQQAQLEIAYENYRVRRFEEAIRAANRFIEDYPSHERIDYAHYLIGLSHFREEKNFLERLSREDPAERDRESMLKAFEEFTRLTELFPDSVYYNDSVERLRYLVNTLARHEAKVARYYIYREAWVAGVNRAKYILENFPDSTSNEEALAILIVGYAALGLEQDRQDALRVLEINYPESEMREPALAGADALLQHLAPGRYSQDWLFS